MEPVRLEILLDDKTLKGMRSVEGNLGSIGQYTEAVIANLESQLKSLQKQFKQAMSTGVNTDAQMADIQALQGVIGQLKAELEELKKIGKGKLLKLDISPYITAEVQALSSAEQKMKVIIANMQQDLDALRQKSLEATVTGVVNEQDQTKIKTLEAGIRSLTAELDKYTASKNRSNETPVIQDDPAPRLNNVKLWDRRCSFWPSPTTSPCLPMRWLRRGKNMKRLLPQERKPPLCGNRYFPPCSPGRRQWLRQLP